jgi:hypothetical protein
VPYGRDDAEWGRLVDAGVAFLIERARFRKVTSYTELNATLARRTGARQFDFEQDGERRAMGALLEAIGERSRPESGVMITALVNYLDQNDAGPGFYAYAHRIGFLRKGARPTNGSISGRTRSAQFTPTTHEASDPPCSNLVCRSDYTQRRFAGISWKPSDGLEPSTPSLPFRCARN